MDLFELLLLFVFFVLPLIQQLVGRRKQRGHSPPPMEGEGEEVARLPVQAPPREAQAGWSAEWGDWPGFEVDEVEEEVLAAEAEATATQFFTGEEISAELFTPEVARGRDPVVSLEPLHVDHSRHPARDHARFHERYLASPPAPPHRAATSRARALLRTPGDLHRAILVAEVLGPPRALNPLHH